MRRPARNTIENLALRAVSAGTCDFFRSSQAIARAASPGRVWL